MNTEWRALFDWNPIFHNHARWTHGERTSPHARSMRSRSYKVSANLVTHWNVWFWNWAEDVTCRVITFIPMQKFRVWVFICTTYGIIPKVCGRNSSASRTNNNHQPNSPSALVLNARLYHYIQGLHGKSTSERHGNHSVFSLSVALTKACPTFACKFLYQVTARPTWILRRPR